jgi:peptidoglycan/xylan/chitin deacetylase (PgdA/CDA1 family)
MTAKPVLMVHEITDEILDLPLADYLLTFDDGTQDHWQYFEQIQTIPTEKIYFIITNRIGTAGYLNLEQVKQMSLDPMVTVGGHSHNHVRLNSFDTLAEKLAHIKQDTEQCLSWFEANLGQIPNTFCLPYNEDIDGLYAVWLKSKGITKIYASERTACEHILS